MPFNYTQPVFNSGNEYQAPGLPYVTSSVLVAGAVREIQFQNVTKFVIVRNTSASDTLRVGFTANGVRGSNYFSLAAGESFSGEFRVRSLFLYNSSAAPTFTVAAGLTGISSGSMPVLSGSTGYEGIG